MRIVRLHGTYIVPISFACNGVQNEYGSFMALSRRKTTVAALRNALGREGGQLQRLAKFSGIPEMTLKKLSAGLRPLREADAVRLAAATGVCSSWLLKGSAAAMPVQPDGKPVTAQSAARVRAYIRDCNNQNGPHLFRFDDPATNAETNACVEAAKGAMFFALGANGQPQARFMLWRLRTAISEVLGEFPQAAEQGRALAEAMEFGAASIPAQKAEKAGCIPGQGAERSVPPTGKASVKQSARKTARKPRK